MQGITPEEVNRISRRLDEVGLSNSRWKPFFVYRISLDIQKMTGEGQSFEEALGYITSDADTEKIPLLENVNPNFNMIRVYRVLIKAGTIFTIACLAAALVFFIMGWAVALPILFTGLLFFMFVVFPLRYFSGSIKDRQENVYIAIFKLHLKERA